MRLERRVRPRRDHRDQRAQHLDALLALEAALDPGAQHLLRAARRALEEDEDVLHDPPLRIGDVDEEAAQVLKQRRRRGGRVEQRDVEGEVDGAAAVVELLGDGADEGDEAVDARGAPGGAGVALDDQRHAVGVAAQVAVEAAEHAGGADEVRLGVGARHLLDDAARGQSRRLVGPVAPAAQADREVDLRLVPVRGGGEGRGRVLPVRRVVELAVGVEEQPVEGDAADEVEVDRRRRGVLGAGEAPERVEGVDERVRPAPDVAAAVGGDRRDLAAGVGLGDALAGDVEDRGARGRVERHRQAGERAVEEPLVGVGDAGEAGERRQRLGRDRGEGGVRGEVGDRGVAEAPAHADRRQHRLHPFAGPVLGDAGDDRLQRVQHVRADEVAALERPVGGRADRLEHRLVGDGGLQHQERAFGDGEFLARGGGGCGGDARGGRVRRGADVLGGGGRRVGRLGGGGRRRSRGPTRGPPPRRRPRAPRGCRSRSPPAAGAPAGRRRDRGPAPGAAAPRHRGRRRWRSSSWRATVAWTLRAPQSGRLSPSTPFTAATSASRSAKRSAAIGASAALRVARAASFSRSAGSSANQVGIAAASGGSQPGTSAIVTGPASAR